MTVALSFTKPTDCRIDGITPHDVVAPVSPTPPSGASTILPSAPTGQSAAGRIEGHSKVSATGAFSYRIPIQVPAGRAGMEPQLALKYDSSGPNGPLGVGWSIEGLSAITRCKSSVAREGFAASTKAQLPRIPPFPEYESFDNFCLDGERLVHVGGSSTAPEFRTEHDSFAKIVAAYDGASNWPLSFTVFHKGTGRMSTYQVGSPQAGYESRDPVTGAPDASSIFAGALSWPLASVQDRFGNTMTYTYQPEGTSVTTLISTITYTGCATGFSCPYAKDTRTVKFNYETRPDFISRWVGGLPAGLANRLKDISIFVNGPLREYKLTYDQSGATSRSRITAVTLCDGLGVCQAPTNFTWGAGKGTDFRPTWNVFGIDGPGIVARDQCTTANPTNCSYWANYIAGSYGYVEPEYPFIVADFDGNGTDDILFSSGVSSGGSCSGVCPPDFYLYLTRVDGNGGLSIDQVHLGMSPSWVGAQAVDIDQDGRSELLAGAGTARTLYRFDTVARNFVPVTNADQTPYTVAVAGNGAPIFFDANGDGVLDYAQDTVTGSNLNHVYVLSYASFGSNSLFPAAYGSAVTLPGMDNGGANWSFQNVECHLVPGDFAGNGFASPVQVCDGGNSGPQDSRFPGPTSPGGRTQLVDLNGDGLADLLNIATGGPNGRGTTRLSTGVAPGVGFAALAPGQLATAESQALPPHDFASGQLSSGVVDPTLLPYLTQDSLEVTADFNGDGLTDVIAFAGDQTKSPSLWTTKAVDNDSVALAFSRLPYTQPRFTLFDPGHSLPLATIFGAHHVGDFNGDGLPDIVQGVAVSIDGLNQAHTFLQFLVQDPSNRDDEITNITSDTVQLAAVGYAAEPTGFLATQETADATGTSGAEVPNCPQTGGVFCPRRGLNVVAQATFMEGKEVERYAYYYEAPAVDVVGRGFQGFTKITALDLQRAKKITSSYENTTREGDVNAYHTYPFAYEPLTIATLTGSAALTNIRTDSAPYASLQLISPLPPLVDRYSVATFAHQTHWLNGHTTFFVENFHSSRTDSDPNANGVTEGNNADDLYYGTTVDRVYDDFGNVTSAVTNDDGTEVTTVTASFSNDTANWLIGLPSVVSTSTNRGALTNTALTTNSFGTNGELLGTTRIVGPAGLTVLSTLVRDEAGLVRTAESHDLSGTERATSYTYSTEGAYVERTEDALGHASWMLHDTGLGVPVLSVDVNGNQTLYQYDGFGRPVGIQPTRAPATTISYAQQAGQVTITRSQSPGTTLSRQLDTRYDLVEQTIKIGADTSTTAYEYDSLGRLTAAHVPYFGVDPGGRTQYGYDNLDNVRGVTNPDGSTVTVNILDPFHTEILTSADQLRRTVVTKTGDGLTTAVSETATTGTVSSREVDYTYAPGHMLASVTELGGPTTSYTYNGLPNPVTISRPESGTTLLSYDGFGNVQQILHMADLSNASYQYDALGRPTELTTNIPNPDGSPGFLTQATQYVYDAGQGALGQLAYSLSPDGVTKHYSYTPEGLTAEVETQAGADDLRVDYTYDNYGRVSHIDYPQTDLTRFGVDLTYRDSPSDPGADGTLAAITRGSATYWQAVTRGPTGLAETATLPGGLTQTLTVDPVTRQLLHINVPSTYDVQYAYYPGGNVQTRTDSLASSSETFTYDPFDQLAQWNVTTTSTSLFSYTYDALGNQTLSSDGVKVFGGAGYSAHQLASQTRTGDARIFQYDALGRQTSMQLNGTSARAVAYTPFDLPRTIVTPTTTLTYKYDANQQKFSEDADTTVTTYVDELYERRVHPFVGNTQHIFYVYADGQRVAQVVQSENSAKTHMHIVSNAGGITGTVDLSNPTPMTPTETVYALHADLHGTLGAVTNVSGATPATSRQSFSPWGERRSASIPDITAGFTDHEHDDVASVVNMRGRMYDPVSAVFLTPDPIVGAPHRVTGWNKYAYVLNNPLKFVDPSGFEGELVYNGPDASVDGGWRVSYTDDNLHGQAPAAALDSNAAPTGGDPGAFEPGNSSSDGSTAAATTPSDPLGPEADAIDRIINNALSDPTCGSTQTCGPTPGERSFAVTSSELNQVPNGWDTARAARDAQRAQEREAAIRADAVPSEGLGPGEMIVAAATLGLGELPQAAEAAEKIATIDTAAVRFTQSSVGQTLRTGENLNDVVAALKGPGGDALAKGFEPIRIFEQNGRLLTLDNRRLLIFSEAGREVPFVWATPGQLAAEGWKFSATAEQAGGWFIRVK
jgi:RHS repeat-associated protein